MKKHQVVSCVSLLVFAFAFASAYAQAPEVGSVRNFISGNWVAIVKVVGSPIAISRSITDNRTGKPIGNQHLIAQDAEVVDSYADRPAQRITLLQPDSWFRPGLGGAPIPPIAGIPIGSRRLVAGQTSIGGELVFNSSYWPGNLGFGNLQMATSPGEIACEAISETPVTGLVKEPTPVTTYLSTRLQSLKLGGPTALDDAVFFIRAAQSNIQLAEFNGITVKKWLTDNVGQVAASKVRGAGDLSDVIFSACALSAGAKGSGAIFLDAMSTYSENGGRLTDRVSQLFQNIKFPPSEVAPDRMIHLAVTTPDPVLRRFFAMHAGFPTTKEGYRDTIELLGSGDSDLDRGILSKLSLMTGRDDLSPVAKDRSSLIAFWKAKSASQIQSMISSRATLTVSH
jgi:hypothetical protein